jgi:hypothetical protein
MLAGKFRAKAFADLETLEPQALQQVIHLRLAVTASGLSALICGPFIKPLA